MVGTILLDFCLAESNQGNIELIRYIAGILLYVTKFFTREEIATRFSYVFASSIIYQALAGLISTMASRSQLVKGWSGWQWIYLLESGCLIALGIMTMYDKTNKVLFAGFA
jgi:hypothetical protein